VTTRRSVLKSMAQASILGVAASPLARNLMAQSSPGPSGPDADAAHAAGTIAGAAVRRCGVQLYTVRGEMQKSVEATLARVASIGYQEVEFAGYFGRTPRQIADALKSNGLTAPSVHVPLGEFSTDVNKTLDTIEAVGHKFAVVPYLDAKDRTLDSYKRLADQFNGWAAASRKRGIQFAYHNHDFEFETMSGEVPYDILLARCDKSLVQFEMDLFWTNKAKRDPLDYFTRHPGRFPLVHVKDMMADGTMTEVGSGAIPFAKYVARASQGGILHYFVEHDNPKDPFASIATSFKALSAL
jgi:sugar phosphate isomerase/epimerase